jgi:hypothetical protein
VGARASSSRAVRAARSSPKSRPLRLHDPPPSDPPKRGAEGSGTSGGGGSGAVELGTAALAPAD